MNTVAILIDARWPRLATHASPRKLHSDDDGILVER